MKPHLTAHDVVLGLGFMDQVMNYAIGLPLMLAAASCVAVLNLPGLVAGVILAGFGFNVLSEKPRVDRTQAGQRAEGGEG